MTCHVFMEVVRQVEMPCDWFGSVFISKMFSSLKKLLLFS